MSSEQTAPTNVELLRRAAALMRERAQAATPGPWRVDVLSDVVADHDDVSWDVADVNVLCPWPSAAEGDDAAHIASWHPAVALAVADLLDALIRRADEIAETFPTASRRAESVVRSTVDGWNEACALARAYLGADS